MNDWFYPQRQRCLGCQKFFGFVIIKRLYCSYECAGMEPPNSDPAQRPRGCRTRVGEAKRAYYCPEEVVESGVRGKDDTLHVYSCDHCGMYHIGHVLFSELNRGGEQDEKGQGTRADQLDLRGRARSRGSRRRRTREGS